LTGGVTDHQQTKFPTIGIAYQQISTFGLGQRLYSWRERLAMLYVGAVEVIAREIQEVDVFKLGSSAGTA